MIASFLGQFVFRYSLKAESLEALTTATIASIIASIIGIPLALITVKIIKDYTEIEPLFYKLENEIEQEQIILNADLHSIEN